MPEDKSTCRKNKHLIQHNKTYLCSALTLGLSSSGIHFSNSFFQFSNVFTGTIMAILNIFVMLSFLKRASINAIT